MKTFNQFLKEGSKTGHDIIVSKQNGKIVFRKYEIGDVLVSYGSYGMSYDTPYPPASIPSYYVVVKVSDSNVWYQQIEKKEIKHQVFMPDKNKKIDGVKRGKIETYNNSVKLGVGSYAEHGFLWDGKPDGQS